MHRYQKATKLLNQNKPEKAVPLFKSFLRDYEFKEAYLNLGNCYRLLDDIKSAEYCYLKANSLSVGTFERKFGEYPLALCNLGLLRYGQGRDSEACELYNKALSIDPMHYDAIWNYSNALLRQHCSGLSVDIAGAWKMYSYRFKRSTPVRIDKALPLWDGVTRVSKICVLAEQGMGDKIMFGRYVQCLRDYADEVWVQIPPELDCFFSDFKICRDSSECVDGYGIPFCSLASRFEASESMLNVAPEWLREKYEVKKSNTGRLRVGVVWSGSASHSNNRNRSVPAGYFTRLSGLADLYGLTPGAKCPRGVVSSGCTTWDETAKFVAGLDLVISVDTSVVHLAGSLGVECWMIQPRFETDFRWGLGSEKIAAGKDVEWNYWYPSVRVIENNDWEKTFDKLVVRLEKYKEPSAFVHRYFGTSSTSDLEELVNSEKVTIEEMASAVITQGSRTFK